MTHLQVFIPIAAIAAIAIVEVVAIQNGHNGAVLQLVIAALAGLGGFSAGRFTCPWRRRPASSNSSTINRAFP